MVYVINRIMSSCTQLNTITEIKVCINSLHLVIEAKRKCYIKIFSNYKYTPY
jgi:hypothetical protein